jgi:hypothetical protein
MAKKERPQTKHLKHLGPGVDSRKNGGFGRTVPSLRVGGKDNFSQQFLTDFLNHWNKPHVNEKGLMERDPETNETIRCTNGQRALEEMYRKSPSAYIKTGQAVFANITPKVHTKEVGENLAGLLRDLNDRDSRNGFTYEGEFIESDGSAPALEDKS